MEFQCIDGKIYPVRPISVNALPETVSFYYLYHMKMDLRVYGFMLLFVAMSAPAFAQQPAFDMGDVPDGHAVAIFAGGCFWCMEPPYDKMDGVVETISGYTGGSVANPTYQQVVRTDTGHYEAILLVYDPDTVSYEQLLDTFWVNVDPLDAGGQFCDRGDSYRTGIFALDAQQRRAAERSIRELEESNRLRRRVVTEVMDADTFYVAEEYHQDYYRKSPLRYRTYRTGCGRDARLRQLWGADAPY